MATYSYRQTAQGGYFDGATVAFNGSPTPNGVGMGPGDTIVIAGRVTVPSTAEDDVSSVQLWLMSDYSAETSSVRKSRVGSVSVRCAAGKSATFTLTTTLTAAMLSGGVANHQTGYLRFGFNGRSTGYTRQATPGPNYEVITNRAAPTVTAALSDRHGADPLAMFGGYLQGASLPRVRVAWTLDSHDSKLTASTVRVRVTDGDSNTIYDGTVPTSQSGSAADFDLPVFSAAGPVTVRVTVTDSAGKAGSAAASATVLAYSPPNIAACRFERFAVVEDSGGQAHEAADDGERVWLTLEASMAPVSGNGNTNAWTAALTAWRAERPEITATDGAAVYETDAGARVTLSEWALAGSDGQGISLTRDEANLSTMRLSAAYDWSLRLTITDAIGSSATLLVADDIQKADALLDVGPYGVAVGQRSTGSAGGGEKFECAWPAQFGADVAVPAGGLLKVVEVTVANAVSQAATSNAAYTAAVSPGDGWTPLCVVGYHSNTSYANFYRVYLDGTTANVSVYNRSTSAATLTLRVYVLCLRTAL